MSSTVNSNNEDDFPPLSSGAVDSVLGRGLDFVYGSLVANRDPQGGAFFDTRVPVGTYPRALTRVPRHNGPKDALYHTRPHTSFYGRGECSYHYFSPS